MKVLVRHGLPLACCLLLGACSPSLNWREVHLGRLSALLPCKPDTGSRQVVLGGQAHTMDMIGCEAGGALFAISRLQANNADLAAAMLTSLRQATLAQVGSAGLHPMPHSGDAQTSLDIQTDGKRSNGVALQARIKWLVVDAEVYQIAVYADRLSTELTESLVSEARIR